LSTNTATLVLLPKKDGGMHEACCHSKHHRTSGESIRALNFLGGEVFAKIFDEDKLQQGAAPAGPERIIHSVKAAIATNPEDTAVLLSDISNA
jgi:hypothetical protein